MTAPHRSPRRLLAAVAVLAALALVAACSGDDSASSGTSTTSTTSGSGTSAPDRIEPVPSAGCAAAASNASGSNAGVTNAGVTDERRTLDVEGVERWYLLTTPPAGTGNDPMPLLLDFHGLAEGAEIHSLMSGFGAIAQREGFVLAQPNGTGSPVRWEATPEDNPDLRFVDRLIDELGSVLCLDLTRVYSTGLSMGAMFTSALACARADRIAAIAPVAGVLYQDGCDPDRPMPVLAIHGTADPIVRFNGGIGDLGGVLDGSADASSVSLPPADIDGPGHPEAVRRWAEHDGCSPTPVDSEPVPDVVLRSYDCPPDAPVEFYVVEGGGHSWPGSEFSKGIASIVGPTNMDLLASERIWEFLSAQRRALD